MIVSSCGEVELRRGRIPRDIGKLASMKSLGACGRPVLAVRPSDYRYASKLAASKGIEVVKATPLNLAVRQASCSLQLKRMKL